MKPENLPEIQFRELSAIDATAVSELRLAVIASDPDTFSVTLAEEKRGSIDILKEVLNQSVCASNRAVYGAFDGGLAGMIGVEQLQGELTKHKARIWGLYVATGHRKCGIGNALITRSIDFARSLAGVEKIVVEVTGSATDARRLYERFGFRSLGTETKALKLRDRYIDEIRMELTID